MRYLSFILLFFYFSAYSQIGGGVNSSISYPPFDFEPICYSDGTDTLEGFIQKTSGKSGAKIYDLNYNLVSGANVVDSRYCKVIHPECVESQEWTYGIDNTGTDYRWQDATYKLTLSDGTTIIFMQSTAANGGWTPQMQEWGDNIQAAADAAGLLWFVETRFRLPSDPSDLSGGGGFAGPPSVAISNNLTNMLWRYVNIQICPGQPVPVRAEVVSVENQGTSSFTRPEGYELTSDGAVKGPLQKFFICTECGEEPVWYLEDGVTLAEAGQIPNCYEPCGTLTLAESPPDRECEFQTVIGCDNNNSELLADFTPDITRRATVCNGNEISVGYFQVDPLDATALIPYDLNGDFVDCATGDVIDLPPIDTVYSATSIVRCYGSDANSTSNHTNTDNATDASFSSNATQMKWAYNQNGFNSDGINDFTLDVFACIDGGEVAKLEITDVAGNVLLFDATSYTNSGNNALFTGTSSASFAGKVLEANLVCGDGSVSGQAYFCSACGVGGEWYDLETQEVIPYESLYECPTDCENEIVEGTACLEADNTQPVLFFIERDCEGVVLNSNYVLPDGTPVDPTAVTGDCDADFSLSTIKDCVINGTGVQYIRYAFFIDGVLDSEFFVNQDNLTIETDIGEYKPCAPILISSISEIEVCADGSPAVKKTIINEDGEETTQFLGIDGTVFNPTSWTAGSCTKTSECIKWRNKYLGIDNTNTSFSSTLGIEVYEGTTLIGTFTQLPSANNTLQLNQWIAALQGFYPNALIEQRYAPNGGAGLPPPTSGLDFDQMAARYVQFTACDGDPLPTDLFIVSVNGNPQTPQQMDTQVIFGEEVRGYVCYECGIEPVVYYEDGTPVDLADVPPCYVTCSEAFSESEPLEITGTVDIGNVTDITTPITNSIVTEGNQTQTLLEEISKVIQLTIDNEITTICADGEEAVLVISYDYEGNETARQYEKPNGTVFTPTTFNDCGSGLIITTNDVGVLFAFGQQGNNQTGDTFNSTIVRTGTGLYTVTFGQPHPLGNDYTVVFGQDENVATRDGVLPHVVDNSKTPLGFQVWVGTGDNGTAADILDNEPWSFHVGIEQRVVTDIQTN